MSKEQKGSSLIIIIICVVGVLIAGLIIWRLTSVNQDTEQKNASATGKQQTNDNESYLVIKEWDVRIKLVEGLEDLKYFKPDGLDDNTFTFTTASLSSAWPNCNEQSKRIVLGTLTRSTEPQPQFGAQLKQIGSYTFQFRGPQATCSDSGAEESTSLIMLTESLKNIEPLK